MSDVRTEEEINADDGWSRRAKDANDPYGKLWKRMTMDELHCPNCQGIRWVIYGVQFETGGTLIELAASCQTDECDTTMKIGVVDGQGIVET